MPSKLLLRCSMPGAGGRGTVANDEPRQILRQVSDFIDRHGDSRFSEKDTYEPPKFGVKDRAGWWTRNDEGKLLYLFTAGGLRYWTW
jgi:putative DNA primase/helicase